MSIKWCLAAALAVLLPTGAPAVADQRVAVIEPGDSFTDLNPVSVTKTFAERHRLAILTEITRRKSIKPDAADALRLDKLGSFYANPDNRPVWTSEDGISMRLQDVKEEFARADHWALDPSAFQTPDTLIDEGNVAALAEVEVAMSVAAMLYAEHAYGGRVDPTKLSLWLRQKPRPVDAQSYLTELADGPDPVKVLRELHPQHPQFLNLLAVYRNQKFPDDVATQAEEAVDPSEAAIPSGSIIKVGQRHSHVALVRARLGVTADSDEQLLDRKLGMAIAKYMRTKGWKYNRTSIDKHVRRLLNYDIGKTAEATSSSDVSLRQLVINMDRWRRMPETFGQLYIWNNLPSYTTKVMRSGAAIHEERIIVGKPETQTPVFSDRMDYVVFKPEWGVPSSIKIRSILPRLRGGDYDVLRRRGMRIVSNSGRTLSPRKFNWSKTKISDISIVQGAGSSNPLGRVKFIFPNEHAVYMHDTPDKHLFKSANRHFSHGCIRVRDPIRLAEVIMEQSNGWGSGDVADMLARKAKENNDVTLEQKIPVHNTYFTVVANADGKVTTYRDIYGHDKRIGRAMDGEPAQRIATSDPARIQKNELKNLVDNGYSIQPKATRRATARQRTAERRAARVQQPTYFGYASPPPPRRYYKARPRRSYGGYRYFSYGN